MAYDSTAPKVPTERPDPKAANTRAPKGEDRPGADLGGASDKDPGGAATTLPDGPVGDIEPGTSGSSTGGMPRGM